MSKDESEEKSEGIKVVDKRRFDESGDSKAGAEESNNFQETKDINLEKKEGTSTDNMSSGNAADPDSIHAPTLDFSSFVMGLATQTLIMLGEIPEPGTDNKSINLEGARQTIDAIAILDEKTKGNLNENEELLLTEALASLRMAYVQKVKEA